MKRVGSPAASPSRAQAQQVAPLDAPPAEQAAAVGTGSAHPHLDPRAIASAPDRTAADRAMDERRQPARLLEFLDIGLTERAADLGTGSGYTAELLARAVGRSGVVYAHNDRRAQVAAGETLAERLRREATRNIVLMQLEYESPFIPEARNLDLVTFLFAYHDTVAQGVDRTRMNAAIFDALKPGGHYVVADHAAEPGAGPEEAQRLHRVSEQLVRREVEGAGFQLVERADFLRDPKDDPRQPSSAGGFHTDRFILKFRRP